MLHNYLEQVSVKSSVILGQAKDGHSFTARSFALLRMAGAMLS